MSFDTFLQGCGVGGGQESLAPVLLTIYLCFWGASCVYYNQRGGEGLRSGKGLKKQSIQERQ